jgi:addiction module HigA family antidote
MNMIKMFNPPHPGETLKEDVLPALGLTVTEAAEQLDVARVTLSRMINGRAAISADMVFVWPNGLGTVTRYGFVCSYSMTYGMLKKTARLPLSQRSRLPCNGAFTQVQTNVPWRNMRNRMAHGYFDINLVCVGNSTRMTAGSVKATAKGVS